MQPWEGLAQRASWGTITGEGQDPRLVVRIMPVDDNMRTHRTGKGAPVHQKVVRTAAKRVGTCRRNVTTQPTSPQHEGSGMAEIDQHAPMQVESQAQAAPLTRKLRSLQEGPVGGLVMQPLR